MWKTQEEALFPWSVSPQMVAMHHTITTLNRETMSTIRIWTERCQENCGWYSMRVFLIWLSLWFTSFSSSFSTLIFLWRESCGESNRYGLISEESSMGCQLSKILVKPDKCVRARSESEACTLGAWIIFPSLVQADLNRKESSASMS